MLMNFCLKLDSLIAKPLTLQLNLMRIWLPQWENHCLIPFTNAWFAKFSSTIFRLGYTASPYDSTLFLRRTDKGTILLLLYVDNMIITGDDLSGIQELKDFLS